MHEFSIGSITQFEEKLEQAQIEMGIDSKDWVPVHYYNEIYLRDTFMNFLMNGPILTIAIIWFIWRSFKKSSQQIFGKGGPGGPMGGIFDIGKSNAKVINKVCMLLWFFFFLVFFCDCKKIIFCVCVCVCFFFPRI